MRFSTKLRIFKLKSLIVSAIIIALYMFFTSIALKMWFVKKSKSLSNTPLILPYVVVHFDLKGTPMKLSYLESLLQELKRNGANSLLIEYEDMFPYEGKLVNLSAESCYEKAELKKFLTLAASLGFEVIPLVQTFGHMEHALKLDEFQHLREVSQHPDSVCPSKPSTMGLVKEMIEQVMKFHIAISPLKFIHVGCDEVFHLNKCHDCVKRNLSNKDIFIHHVRTISNIVKSLHADTTMLIWDDMLRGIKPKKWNEIEKFDNVQPVYWDYTPQIKVNHINLLNYHSKFRQIWIASAFKGADGRIATFPSPNNRFLNVFHWLNYIKDYRFGGEDKIYNFQGVILTGWSRYSHMDPPCELLPVSYPILIINLLLVQKFKTGQLSHTWVDKSWDLFQVFIDEHLNNSTLECFFENNVFDESNCKFDGQHLFKALVKYSELCFAISKQFDSIEELGITCFEYYSKLGILNTNKVTNHIASLNSNLRILMEIENWIAREMQQYYEKDFIAEYVNFKTYYHKNELQSALNSLNSYLKVRSWPRRTRNSSYFLE